MYLIECIDEDRDVILRKAYKNVKEFLGAIYNYNETLKELSLLNNSCIIYADASVNGSLISRFCEDDLMVTMNLEGVLKQYEVFENLPYERTWEKLWLKPVSSKISAYVNLLKDSRKLLPFVESFYIKDTKYSFEKGDEKVPHRLVVFKEEPGKIFKEDRKGVPSFFASVEDFHTVSLVMTIPTHQTLIHINSYKEVLCQ